MFHGVYFINHIVHTLLTAEEPSPCDRAEGLRKITHHIKKSPLESNGYNLVVSIEKC